MNKDKLNDRAPSAQVIALPELHPHENEVPSSPVLQDTNPLRQIKTRLRVCVGEATITVGELLAAQEHQVLRLDRTLDQPVDLMLEGRVVAQGQLVAVDDHFAVRITALPIPLTLSSVNI